MKALRRAVLVALLIALFQLAPGPTRAASEVVIGFGTGHHFGRGFEGVGFKRHGSKGRDFKGRGFKRHRAPLGHGWQRPYYPYGFFRYGGHRRHRHHHGLSLGFVYLPPIVVSPAPPVYYPGASSLPPPAPPTTLRPRAEAFERSHCEPYTAEVVIDGETQALSGTACRQADGRWRLID